MKWNEDPSDWGIHSFPFSHFLGPTHNHPGFPSRAPPIPSQPLHHPPASNSLRLRHTAPPFSPPSAPRIHGGLAYQYSIRQYSIQHIHQHIRQNSIQYGISKPKLCCTWKQFELFAIRGAPARLVHDAHNGAPQILRAAQRTHHKFGSGADKAHQKGPPPQGMQHVECGHNCADGNTKGWGMPATWKHQQKTFFYLGMPLATPIFLLENFIFKFQTPLASELWHTLKMGKSKPKQIYHV